MSTETRQRFIGCSAANISSKDSRDEDIQKVKHLSFEAIGTVGTTTRLTGRLQESCSQTPATKACTDSFARHVVDFDELSDPLHVSFRNLYAKTTCRHPSGQSNEWLMLCYTSRFSSQGQRLTDNEYKDALAQCSSMPVTMISPVATASVVTC